MDNKNVINYNKIAINYIICLELIMRLSKSLLNTKKVHILAFGQPEWVNKVEQTTYIF